jgi:TolB-like protein/Tfp pilus assembly protein PilF
VKEFAQFRLDTADQTLWREDRRVPLTPKAFAVLSYLVERHGRLVTQDELLESVWAGTFVQPEVLKSQILDIRAALGDRPKDPLFIETVPRRGYRFIAGVREASAVVATVDPGAPNSVPAPPLSRTRIAVLPFVNMSSDPENEYFSDGLTEELINQLAGVPGLQVVARTSAFAFKTQTGDIREIGAKLNAGTVLEGSVRRAADQLRVTAQLIDVQSGYHLFSRTYQRAWRDVFALQDELAQAVVAEIASPGNTRAGPSSTRTGNLEAYNKYLKGMFALEIRYFGVPAAIEHFTSATECEPNYAPAWAGLASAYFQLAWFRHSAATESMPLAQKAARRSVEIDPNGAAGLAALAAVECAFEWKWEAGQRHFERAMELQPSLASMYPYFAHCCLMPQLRYAEACRLMEQALKLDPFNPVCHSIAIFCYTHANRFPDAFRQHKLAFSINPDYPPLEATVATTYEFSGQWEQAIASYRRASSLSKGAPIIVGYLGHALARTGASAEARELLADLQSRPHPVKVDLARVHLGLEDFDTSLDCLEEAVKHKELHLLNLPFDRRFHPLRSHPRFQHVLRQMGLAHNV